MKPLHAIPVIMMLVGCSTSDSRTSETLNVEEASRLAQQLANQRAQILFQLQPFRNGPQARFTAGRWEWRDQRGYGHGDMEARVSFDPNGSRPDVEVLLLDSQTQREF